MIMFILKQFGEDTNERDGHDHSSKSKATLKFMEKLKNRVKFSEKKFYISLSMNKWKILL